MNLVIIWLIVSVVSTIIVLMSIRSAPFLEDEPLDSDHDPKIRFDSRHGHDSDRPRASGNDDLAEIRGTNEVNRTSGRSTLPTLGNFPISRSKHPSS